MSSAPVPADASPAAERLDLPRTFKIGSFHIGSASVDMLTAAVWNRILIGDLGIAATPVALLSALRYLLAPLSLWAGHRSDTRPLFGYRRLPYIWGGRALMLLSLTGLPVSTWLVAADPWSVPGWTLIAATFLVYGIGTLLSGSPFLALIRDRTPPTRRGQALSIAQIMLLAAMVLVPALYGLLIEHYTPEALLRTVLIGGALAIPFWLLSIAGEDRRVSVDEPIPEVEASLGLPALLRLLWADRRSQAFFLLLALGAVGVFAQDAILEPFGGEVFGLNVGQTTRFNAWWGLGILVSMILTTVLTRRRAPHEQTPTARLGLALTAASLALLALVASLRFEAGLIPVLVLFGVSFGIYTVGAIGLLMAMTLDRHAGACLGLWTLAQLTFRGVGIALGGILLDLGRWLLPATHLAYGAVFLLEALLLLACLRLLARVDAPGFAAGRPPAARHSALALAD